MTEKITKQVAEKYLTDLLEQKQLILDSGCITPIKWSVGQSYIDKGVSMTEMHCQACGNVYTTANYNPYAWRRSNTHQCTKCGNNHYTFSRSVEADGMSLVVMEKEDGFDFFLVKTRYKFDESAEDWYDIPPEMDIFFYAVGMFRNNNGWYVYDNMQHKVLKRDCQAEMDILANVKSQTPLNNIIGSWPDMIDETKKFDELRAAKNAERKNNSKGKLLEDMRQQYRPRPIDESALHATVDTILYDVYSSKGGKTTYITCCTKCGATEIVDNVEFLSCHACGNTATKPRSYYSSSNKHHSQSVVLFENTNLPENDMLARIFDVDVQYNQNSGLERRIWERQRIFFGKKLTVYQNGGKYASKPTSAKFDKATVRDISNCVCGWHPDAITVQQNDEVRDIIKASCLAYSGLVENWRLGDKRYLGAEEMPHMHYITSWYKKPAIELIVKANLTNLMVDLIRNPEHIGEGTTLADALQVKPAVVKMAIQLNCNRNQLCELSSLHNEDPNITADLYNEISRSEVGVHNVVRLKREFGISYAQTLKYMEAVYNNQCIPKREALGIWVDYLAMARMLHIDLTDKGRLYPGSLKKEHDVASFAYKAVKVEIDKEVFAAQAKLNTYYEYTYKDLMVVVPKTPQDIVEEATRQKNCLRSYVERVKNGDTVVVFIRRKIMPDATYVTAEVHGGKLTQLKGYCNSNPRDRELLEFVQHWAKAKAIMVEC